MSALHILQSIADESFGEFDFDGLPTTNNQKHVLSKLRLLKLFGDVGHDIDLEETVDDPIAYMIRHGVYAKRPDGSKLKGSDMYKMFKKGSSPKPNNEKDKSMVITKVDDTHYTVENSTGSRTVRLKLYMDEGQIEKVCSIACRFSPPGSIVEMQADSHNAGDIFVGMVMVFDSTRIPISLVSNDIGCGLTLVPMVGTNGEQLHVESMGNLETFKVRSLLAARSSLKRGRVSETQTTVCDHMYDAGSFYEEGEMGKWLSNMKDVLYSVGLWREALKDRDGPYMDLDEDQHTCLKYIGRYAQTLGSSGNHFLEVSEDDRGYIWAVIHSGSRRLGSMIYTSISNACRILNGGDDIATGQLAILYTKAYHCLDKFARMNRCACAISVMKTLGLESNGSRLATSLMNSWIFKDVDHGGCSKKLLHGLTHNGIKTFVNHTTKKKVSVLTKGAIAVSARSSSSIVALKAGDGCVVFVLSDPECEWEESTEHDHYEMTLKKEEWSDGIVFAGHGAGRRQSTTKSENEYKFDDLVEFFNGINVTANIAPGVLGDHPGGAYKDTKEVIEKLPLDIAVNYSYLRTMVSYKEGLPKGPNMSKRLAGYVNKNWGTMTDKDKVCIDITLIQKELGSSIMGEYSDEVGKIVNEHDWGL